MTTPSPPTPHTAPPQTQHTLLIVRWSSFGLALMTGAIAPFLISDRLRTRATEKLQTEEEIELATMFGQWFAALSNLITLGLFSLLLAGIITLITRQTAPGRTLTIRLISQTVLCLVLTATFIAGVIQ